MARRSDHTRAELKTMAVQAGLELLEESGFAGFSARKVANRIGYTIGTIYNVFGTHDEFLLQVNARTLDEWYSFLKRAIAAEPEKPLHGLAHGYIRFSREHYHRWLALFEHHMANEAPLPDWYMPHVTRFFALLEDILRPLLNGDEIRVKHGARVMWSSIHGVAVLSATHKLDLVTGESAEQLAHATVDTFLAGLQHG